MLWAAPAKPKVQYLVLVMGVRRLESAGSEMAVVGMVVKKVVVIKGFVGAEQEFVLHLFLWPVK